MIHHISRNSKSGTALRLVSLLNRVTVKTVGEKASRQPTFGSAALLYKMRTKRHFEFVLSFTVLQYRKTMKLDRFLQINFIEAF